MFKLSTIKFLELRDFTSGVSQSIRTKPSFESLNQKMLQAWMSWQRLKHEKQSSSSLKTLKRVRASSSEIVYQIRFESLLQSVSCATRVNLIINETSIMIMYRMIMALCVYQSSLWHFLRIQINHTETTMRLTNKKPKTPRQKCPAYLSNLSNYSEPFLNSVVLRTKKS